MKRQKTKIKSMIFQYQTLIKNFLNQTLTYYFLGLLSIYSGIFGIIHTGLWCIFKEAFIEFLLTKGCIYWLDVQNILSEEEHRIFTQVLQAVVLQAFLSTQDS